MHIGIKLILESEVFNKLLAIEINDKPAVIFKKNIIHININCELCNNVLILK